MKKIAVISVLCLSTLTLSGCKDILGQLTGLITSEQPTESDIFKFKLKTDLKAFDRIRVDQNSIFFDLEDLLRKAADKNQSTPLVRSELLNISNTLSNQNDRFKTQHFQTPDIAKLRNMVMELNYATVEIIQFMDNPDVISSRLNTYLSKQKNLINNYNKLRTESEAKL